MIIQIPIFKSNGVAIARYTLPFTNTRCRVRISSIDYWDSDNNKALIQIQSPQLNRAGGHIQFFSHGNIYKNTSKEFQYDDCILNGYIDIQLYDVSSEANQITPSPTMSINLKYVLLTLDIEKLN